MQQLLTCEAEQKVDQAIADTMSAKSANFAETKPQSESGLQTFASQGFQESNLKTVGLMALGAAFAGTIGGLVNSFFPLGSLSIPVAGYLMTRFFKGGSLHTIGMGVLVAGVAVFLSGLTGSLGGILGGGGQSAAGASNAGMTVVY